MTEKYAKGGKIEGREPGDTVPIFLTPADYPLISADQVKRLGGERGGKALRRMITKSEGGLR